MLRTKLALSQRVHQQRVQVKAGGRHRRRELRGRDSNRGIPFGAAGLGFDQQSPERRRRVLAVEAAQIQPRA